MNSLRPKLELPLLVAWFACGATLFAQTASSSKTDTGDAVLLTLEGKVEVSPAGATAWAAGRTNQTLHVGDRLRTALRSRATVRLANLSVLRVNELSFLQIEPPSAPGKQSLLNLKEGATYFLSRERPGELEFRTPTASGAIRGTEFHLAVASDGRSVVTLLDGVIALNNPQGSLDLASGEAATIQAGQAPVKTAVLNAVNVIQWCLYYPGVLDADELGLGADEQSALADSLSAYRRGDLLAALANYPEARQPASAAERIYYAALLLSVGQAAQAETRLGELPQPAPLAGALREVIAAVKLETWSRAAPAATATEWLAESYHHQSRSKLAEALAAARQATVKSPNFGLAWARVAELEFSFGRVPAALDALEKSLQLAPRNAEALALKGFLLAAQNKIPAAREQFEDAIALDGALGNAWLGRGLVRIRAGDENGGRQDLQVAATLEPQRALLRSYLGKAFANARDSKRAAKELALARKLDPNDPTVWLYAALLEQQENQINDAVRDLEKSKELNDNRRVYRSRLLLDQDRAVRGANLANIYRDAGMVDVSVREAGRAVNVDYANYSAHLFLANSYNELRDPRSVNLRYETPYLSEYLLANLLAPVGAGTLSQSVSQQEYSKLFERDRLGFASATEYLSRGAWSQNAVQFGTIGNTSYALEADYLKDPGQRQNQDLEQTAFSLQLKQQLGPADSFYFQALSGDTRAGDLNQYADPTQANATIRVHDEQEPILLAGYHHEWGPGSHSLVLLSRLDSRLRVEDPQAGSFLYRTDGSAIDLLRPMPFQQSYDSSLEIYSAEVQQIWQRPRHALVVGGRVQFGDFDTANRHRLTGTDEFDFVAFNLTDPDPQQFSTSFERETAYAYYFWQIWEPFQIVGGLAYDRIEFPRDHRFAPIADETDVAEDVLPKIGFQWFPTTDSAVRFAWTRSLSGASFDQSFRLEPVQVAGFNQAFRSIIPETLTGANAGAPFESFGLAWEQRLRSGTYFGISGEFLLSDFDRWRGAYLFAPDGQVLPSHLAERLNYQEKCLRVTLDQLVGRDWVLGARYQWCRAWLDQSFPDAPPQVPTGSFTPDDEPVFGSSRSSLRGDLHQVGLHALFNHPSGFFAGTEGVWYGQTAENETGRLVSSWFWQWHARAGWRSPRRRVEVSLAVLNILDEAQGLHPINLHTTPPQRRTLAASFRFNF